MPYLHVLVVDDEPAVRQVLAETVSTAGYSVAQAANVAEAAARLVRGDVDVALCDIKMPDGNGIDLLRNIRASGIDTTFIMVTAFGSLETAVDALRAGAFDYIIKPVREEELLHRLSQVEALQGLREENKALRQAVSATTPRLYRFESPKMLEVERRVAKIAPTDNTVLITGESGTGKGVTARAIHEQSERRNGPFLSVNCSAIPENLLESEFFGHTKGAFTGADRARKGLFLQAHKGTLFLDEISELPLHLQAKLLNAIEDKEVRPLGSDQARRIDVRIIAATNCNLAERVTQGTFREDLFFRLGVLHIRMPPLRELQGDIPGLIRFLLQTAKADRNGSRVAELDPAAEACLRTYAWPGNLRELENVLNHACVLAEGDWITVGDLPPEIAAATPQGLADTAVACEEHLREQLRKVEADILLRAIEAAGGDRRLAAQKLGIHISSLYRKLDEFERHGLTSSAVPSSGIVR